MTCGRKQQQTPAGTACKNWGEGCNVLPRNLLPVPQALRPATHTIVLESLKTRVSSTACTQQHHYAFHGSEKKNHFVVFVVFDNKEQHCHPTCDTACLRPSAGAACCWSVLCLPSACWQQLPWQVPLGREAAAAAAPRVAGAKGLPKEDILPSVMMPPCPLLRWVTGWLAGWQLT
jgi:hypothetical protein